MEHEASFLSALLGLIFVLGVIFLTAYLFKRFGSHLISGVPVSKKKPEMTILDIRVVDPKNRLVLFRCRNKDYLALTGETNCLVDSFAVQENQEAAHADA
ncbi:MAG: FliO/MopB family protein [Alphaproteobacteria bacterium]|nr:FliO/MopB family protein [Alphaproteobacteria bacterium]